MSGWRRQRHPDDVPTPIAVAVADFCRRAKAPAAPALVREALALLNDDDDAAVKALTNGEPSASPLGPFAVVDLVKGTTAAVAAHRQTTGYYEMARLAAQSGDEQAAEEQAPARPVKSSAQAAQPTSKAAAMKSPAPKKPRVSVGDKIAPKKRQPGTQPSRARPVALPPATSFLPRRNLPAPRGRYTQLDSTRGSLESLLRSDAKGSLEAVVQQSPTRFHVFKVLEPGYTGRNGRPLTVPDVEGAITRHQLFDDLKVKERDSVLMALTMAKGSTPQAARQLDVKPADIDTLVASLRLKREVGEIKERFVREALDPSNLSLRLELLARPRYLADLRIEKRFAEALSRDVARLLDESADAGTTVSQVVDATARKHALPSESLARAVELLGLTARYLR